MGIDICLHYSFFLILVLMPLALSEFCARMAPELSEFWHWTLTLFTTIGVFGSIVIHELAHAKAAKRYGIKTEKIILIALGAMAQFEEAVFPSPKSEFAISVLGPLSNFAVAGLCWFGHDLIKAAYPFGTLGIAGSALLQGLFTINIIIAIFNLIPAFPMDGGRILRAILWKFSHNLVKATKIARDFGAIIAILLPICFFYFGGIGAALWMLFISFFIYVAGTAEYEDIKKLMKEEARAKENQKNNGP